jgi:hypothetical protein
MEGAMAPPKRDDFMEGFRGTGWDKYSPGYRNGETWRKALTDNPPRNAAAPLWFAPPTHHSVPPLPGPRSSSAFETGIDPGYGGSSRDGRRMLNLFAAIAGALILASMAASATSGPTIALAAGAGAIIGWIAPFVLSLLAKLVAMLFRLTFSFLKVALWMALLGGIVYMVIKMTW